MMGMKGYSIFGFLDSFPHKDEAYGLRLYALAVLLCNFIGFSPQSGQPSCPNIFCKSCHRFHQGLTGTF